MNYAELETERSAFEVWMSKEHPGVDLSRRVDGSYWSSTPDSFFEGFLGGWRARAVAEANSVPDVENMLLRQMLAIRVAGAALYSDDGELQDNSAHPCIDFKRDPAHLIHYKLKARLSASPAPAQQERKPMSDAVIRERARLYLQDGRSYRGLWDESVELASRVLELGFIEGAKAAERHHGIKE